MRTPSIPRNWLVGIGLVYAVIILYSTIVTQQLLLGIILPALVFLMAYVTWRVWRVFTMYEQKLEGEADGSTHEEGGDAADGNGTGETDPVEQLKQRYAAGELTEAEFEAELERLLEDEERSSGVGTDPETDVGGESDSEELRERDER